MPDATMRESSTEYGVYVWEKWPGVTVIAAIDHDGVTLCETSMRSELLCSDDIQRMRDWLGDHTAPMLRLVRS